MAAALVAGLLGGIGVLSAADLATALRLASAGRFEEAEQVLVTLENADPQNAEVKYRLGLVLLRQGKLKEAGARLEPAAKLSPESPLVWLALAQLRLRQGDAASATRAAEQARSLGGGEPTVAKALFLFDVEAIRHHLEAGRAEAAAVLARQAITRDNAAVFHHLLAKAQVLQKKPAAAVEQFQEAIRRDPAQPEYYGDLAALFLDHRTPEPAAIVLAAAIQRFPKHVGLARLQGVLFLGQGKIEEAIDAFVRAIDLDPDNEGGYASLETLIPQAGDRLPEVTRRLAAFAEKHPESALGHYLLALASPERAEQRLRRAIAAAPDFWPAQFELHKILKEQGKTAAAVAALERVIALHPGHAPAHFGLAQMYAQLGDRERARREREIHHKLVEAQRAEEEKRREQAPKLSYRVSDR
jgi:tetratricopeptide (TPR) repeat protein